MPDRAVEIGNLTNLRAVSDHFRNISAGMCNIIHAVLPFCRPYAISACYFSSVTPCRVLSSSTECNINHAALLFHRPYAISACFIKPDRKLPRLFADAGTWFRNETLVSAASATKRECAWGWILSGDLPNESVPAEGFCPATIQTRVCRRKGSVRQSFYNLLRLSNFGILVFSFSIRAFSLSSSFL